MKTETPPTIAELWSRFDSIKNRFGSSKDYAKLIDLRRYANPAQGRIDWVKEIVLLRQQLVERCSVPCYNFNASPLEEIEYHKEMSAIHGFWAWELEQRQREKEAGNG